MAYVITTTDTRLYADDPTAEFLPGAKPVQTRRAVATLDEARGAVLDAARQATGDVKARGAQWAEITESGGTATLPDGTVIEVTEMVNTFGRPDMRGYLRGWHFPSSMDDAEIIDAYNAAQEAN